MTTRRQLPNRRQHEIIEFELGGVSFTAGIGRFDDGGLAEIFFHAAGKPGSSSERFAADCAVLCSLAFQHGASVAQVCHSLPKLRDGKGAGPVGRLLDLIEPNDG